LHRWFVGSFIHPSSFVLRRSPFVIYSLVDVTLIDWFSVLSATLWISGLAFLLALFGLARAARERSTRQVLAQPHFRVAMMLGIVLFALGMGLSVGTWFERIGWGVVTALALWEAYSARRQRGTQ